MALNGYTPNYKYWDEIGRITPNVAWSESHRPHAEFMVAPWLPVARYDEDKKFYITVSSGKMVAIDRNKNLVPAGLKKAFNVATSSTVLSYTATDATEGVINLVTGSLVTGAVSYTEAQVTAGLRERGLIKATERAYDFISPAVGFAPYNYYKAAGLDHYNPRTLFQHNFRPQDLVAISCDYVITLPVVPAAAATEATVDKTAAGTGYLEDLFDGTVARNSSNIGFVTATQIAEVTRYSSVVTSSSKVIGMMVVNAPMAVSTSNTPVTASTDSCLVREVGSIDAVVAAGDYFIDYPVGMIFLYSADGSTIPSPWVAATTTVSYYHYNTAASTTITTYACATGDLQPGDFVTYDSNSNIIKSTLDIGTAEGYVTAAGGALYSADPEYDTESTNSVISAQIEKAVMGYTRGIVGQVLGVVEFGTDRYSKTYLDRVKTAYEGTSTAIMQTPGSATGGRTDQLTYANAAERMIIINMIWR